MPDLGTLLSLFWIFFKIGLFTFGGGYAMIPLIRSELVGGGFITEEALIDFIAVSESTPGPFAVNVATFIGTEAGGIVGAVVTTLGVVLPSFLVLLLIARFSSRVLETKTFKAAFLGLRPAVVGLVFGVAFTLAFERVFPSLHIRDAVFDFSAFDAYALVIMTVIFVLSRKFRKVSPILLLLLAAVLGVVLYGIF
ncbi:MAG: chromate transporter [Candidatus Izemoplasmatales bacterium]